MARISRAKQRVTQKRVTQQRAAKQRVTKQRAAGPAGTGTAIAKNPPAATAAIAATPARKPAARTRRLAVAIPAAERIRYEVLVGVGLLGSDDAAVMRAIHGRRSALMVVDANLGPTAVEPLIRRLDARRVRWGVCVLRASEEDKTLESAGRALAEAARLRLERGDVVIAIGGGVVTDIAGFVAATYRRGVDVVQCPTTLLAMVDAAVGGKTGVNVWAEASAEDGGKRRLVKNAVGCFHQPVLVCCDVAMLRTLPEREFCSGLAECIKHGLIGGAAGDAKLLEWTAANMPRLRGLDASALVELVTRNVAIKSRVVRGDPLERSTRSDGGRMMLNLGHTFAHAIETLGGLSWRDGGGAMRVGPLKHGEAVGLGLLAAVRASEALRIIRRGTAEEVGSLLEKAGLPTRVMGLPPSEAVVDRMKDDKKVMAGRLRLILPTTGRKCRVVEGPDLKVVQSAVDSLRAE